MTEPQDHVPVEELAAYAAGDLDATAAVAVEAHLLLCADCRADVDAVAKATALLGTVEPVAMPHEVAASVDAALAEAATRTGPVGDVLPMKRRSRPSFAGIAAVAAGVALVGAIGVPLVRSGGTSGDSANQPERAAGAQSDAIRDAAGTRRLNSNLDYSPATIGRTLDSALSGEAGEKAAPATAPKANAPGAASGGPELGTGATDSAVQPDALAARRTSLTALQAEPGRLAACIAEIAPPAPPEAGVPLVADFARFGGKPALVLVFPTVSRGGVVTRTVDVYVVGAGCGTEPGGDVLQFVRIPRPAPL